MAQSSDVKILDGATSDMANKPVERPEQAEPERPPVSPITPTRSFSDLAEPTSLSLRERGLTAEPASFIEKPAPVETPEEDNTDIAAIQAAISILQVQKEKTRRDIRTLQDLKEAASKNPEQFQRELFAGKLRYDKEPKDALAATFEDDADGEDSISEGEGKADSDESAFPKIPTKQDVFRCPPVNWAKYHIVGEPLDKMREDNPYGSPSSANTARSIASPYDPLASENHEDARHLG